MSYHDFLNSKLRRAEPSGFEPGTLCGRLFDWQAAKRAARGENDEAHICPLQLDVIDRCVELWSAEGDVVFSPFAGIGSEGYVALQKGRRFVGCELKDSYASEAEKYLRLAARERKEHQQPLFTQEPTG